MDLHRVNSKSPELTSHCERGFSLMLTQGRDSACLNPELEVTSLLIGALGRLVDQWPDNRNILGSNPTSRASKLGQYFYHTLPNSFGKML